MTDVDILPMPVDLKEGPRLDAWLAAIRAFDLDPGVIVAYPSGRVLCLALHPDGSVVLTCDVLISQPDELPIRRARIDITRPATVVALALDGIA